MGGARHALLVCVAGTIFPFSTAFSADLLPKLDPGPRVFDERVYGAICEQSEILRQLMIQDRELAAKEAESREQMLFVLQAIALTLSILWGAYTWRLIVLAKNQRSMW